MAKTITAARKHVWTALAVSAVGQFLLTALGNNWPEDSEDYGAPFSVGDSTGWSSDAIWVGHAGNFFLPLWVVNVGVTAVIVLALAIALNGGLRVGLVAAPVAVFAAYLTVVVVQGPHAHSNQMLIWLWMLMVLAAAWGIRRRLG
jgi:MYXO-CTERM domain-containing protein